MNQCASSARTRPGLSLCQSSRHTCRPQALRLDRAWERESGRFQHDYNDRLLAGLVGLSLLDILVFRFVVRVALLETLGWLSFAFLQVHPHLPACRPPQPRRLAARSGHPDSLVCLSEARGCWPSLPAWPHPDAGGVGSM